MPQRKTALRGIRYKYTRNKTGNLMLQPKGLPHASGEDPGCAHA